MFEYGFRFLFSTYMNLLVSRLVYPSAMKEPCPFLPPLQRMHKKFLWRGGEIVEDDRIIAGFFGDWRWLSNFWPATVTFDGVDYSTVEHAYQAAKTSDLAWRQRIRSACTPWRAKRLGRQVPLRDGWDQIKLSVMETLVRQKFERNSELGKKLTATYPSELQELNNWGDHFYGICNGTGENHLGKILMKVRSELRNASLVQKREVCCSPTRVIHIREAVGASNEVYIGRAGKGYSGDFGNPIRKNTTCPVCGKVHRQVQEILPCYKKYLWERFKRDPSFLEAVKALRGRILVCFCKPRACHGDVLVDAIAWLHRNGREEL